MNHRVAFGTLATMFAAIISAQAIGEKAEWPILRRLFDGDALIIKDAIYFIASIGAAVCGYLAAAGEPKGEHK